MRSFKINSKHGEFEVLVDDDDYDRVMEYNWSISKSNKNYFRVESRIKYKLIRLHRFILNLTSKDPQVDHKDGNTLNNQKSNLRTCTIPQNMRNCRSKGNKTGYRGVYKNRKKYRACISINDKTFHIPGNFDTAEEAARVRDEWALKISGEFAVLNFKKERR